MRILLCVLATIVVLHAEETTSQESVKNEYFLNGKPFNKIKKSENSYMAKVCVKYPGKESSNAESALKEPLEHFPWNVIIIAQNANKKEVVCSGTLISSQHVLTAAHCAFERNYETKTRGQLHVAVGGICGTKNAREPCEPGAFYDADQVNSETTYAVQSVLTFRKFFDPKNRGKEFGFGDFAILELEKKAWDHKAQEKRIHPVCLPSGGFRINSEHVYISALGKDDNQYNIDYVIGKVNSGRTKKESEKNDCLYASNVHKKTTPVDSEKYDGSGLLFNNNNRWLALGPLSGADKGDNCFIDTRKYVNEICEAAGICYNNKEPITPSTTTTTTTTTTAVDL